MLNGGNFKQLLAAYNRKMQDLHYDFIKARTREWAAVREVEPLAPFEAEVNSVPPTKARDSENQYKEATAPRYMVFDSIDHGILTDIGDTSHAHSVNEQKTKVSVHLNARSRRQPAGKSHIQAAPTVTWRYSDPQDMAKNEVKELEQLLTQ